jgi:glycosyltransferase involved in cell wall biosynthesis
MPCRLPLTSRPPAAIRVASVPASHVYVRHLSHPDRADGVERLPDVEPSDGARVPGGWWPPLMLDAAWISDNRDRFDVFHVHFGFDGKSLSELEDALLALDEVGAPLVFTLHDLRNPHHEDTDRHAAQLDILVRHSAELVTLTAGAARAIGLRWGRRPHVLPHPHVVGEERLAAPRPARDDFVVGVHAKSVRANMDVVPVVAVLADALSELPGARLRVDLHDEVSSADSYWYAPDEAARLRALAGGAEHVELREHPYFTDEELWDYLRAIDVSVLPYRFGTHSGWLEACYDLGTTVVAPDCGFYSDQRPCLTYRHDERGLDAASLADALRAAHGLRPRWRATLAGRMRERRALARRHRVLYERLLACT